uniref:Ionotropic receptor 93a n=1 Tax=Aulacocentrum confusum TaxID=2767324 RepID=A0A7G8Z9J0_9HYME|nr:ionotropic receptor 93a [Aulacocentrum confusum]
MGKSLPIATYHNPPWQYEMSQTQSDEKQAGSMTSKWDGLIFDVVEELANRLNFSFKPVVVEAPPEIIIAKADPLRASMSASEKVPDAVTELVRSGSVFLAACAYTISTHGKDPSINLTQAISLQTYGLLAPRPKPLSRALLFASPFSNEAWACLASAIILVGPVLYAVHTLSSRTTDTELKDPGSVLLGLDSPSRCIWYIYGALLQQGGMNLPKNDGARLIVGTWWLVVMVVVATYSGSLVAFLTFPRMEMAVKTVDDLLARKSEFTWSIPAGSFLEDYLLVSSAEGTIDYRNLLQEHEPHAEKHGTTTYLQNVQKVKRGKHALIDWVTSLMISTRNEYVASGSCHFSLGTDVLILGEPISMIVPAGSPYLALINVQLQRMQEAGLLNKWTADRIPVKDQCSEGGIIARETDNHKVNLEDMQGIFFILLLGYFIGTLTLGWEFIRRRLKIAKEAKLIRPFID